LAANPVLSKYFIKVRRKLMKKGIIVAVMVVGISITGWSQMAYEFSAA